MKILSNKTSGSSLIEAMIIVMILAIGIMGGFDLVTSGNHLAISTKNRITAINLAREWLEVFENIRNTNWLRFPSNTENCWMTDSYNSGCLINKDDYKIDDDPKYIITLDGTNAWNLTEYTGTNSTVFFSENGFSFQDPNGESDFTNTCLTNNLTSCISRFKRYISIEFLTDLDETGCTEDTCVRATSTVEWSDLSGDHDVELSVIYRNWIDNL